MLHSIIYKGIKIILLDSVSPGNPEGSLSDGVLVELEKELHLEAYSVLFLHQPPFPSGIGFMDNQKYKNKNKFLDILGNANKLLVVGCGHIHRTIFSRRVNTNFTVAPSTAMQLDLNLSSNAPGDFVFETPGYLIHRIDLSKKNSPELISYGVQITNKKEMEITYPFNN